MSDQMPLSCKISAEVRQPAANSLPWLGVDHEGPFWEGFGPFETGGDGAEGAGREADAGLVDTVQQMHDRSHPTPCHRLGPLQSGFDGSQQRAVPVVFQDTPAAFDRVVLAVIRRVVRQFQCQLMPIRELDQTLHELRSGTGDFRAVVQIDQQPAYAGMCGLAVGPPQFQTIRHKVAGIARRAEDHVQLIAIDFQNAGGREHRVGMHIMVRRPHRLLPPAYTATREFTDLHFGLGVERDAERLRVVRGLRVDLSQMIEDGVGLGHFF